MGERTVQNPVVTGFNPDPSVVKVGDTYFLAVSTFEWLPGVRFYCSKDLGTWTYVGDALTSGIDFKGIPIGGSIWAPNLTYHNQQFYLVYTVVKSTKRPFKDCHNYVITAPEITGPWSEPVYLNSSGFDPSFFFEDGKIWMINEYWDYRLKTPNKSAGIVIQEYDEQLQQLVGEAKTIFEGTSLRKTEAPNLYKIGEYYYLIVAEGGTGKGHSVTVCRSRSLHGPYEVDPNNPMLTASDDPQSYLQCTGHASLVQTNEKRWYIIYLCTRPIEPFAAVLGRETAIQEVYFNEEGWLRCINGTNKPDKYVSIYSDEKANESVYEFNDKFNNTLSKEWNGHRIFIEEHWCQTASNTLTLVSGESLQSSFDKHLIAIRQKSLAFETAVKVTYETSSYNQMAGLCLYLNEDAHVAIFVTFDETLGQCLCYSEMVEGNYELAEQKLPLETKNVYVSVKCQKDIAYYYYRNNEQEEWQKTPFSTPMKYLSGGFTGNFIGLFVSDLNRFEGSKAQFEEFCYRELSDQ